MSYRCIIARSGIYSPEHPTRTECTGVGGLVGGWVGGWVCGWGLISQLFIFAKKKEGLL